MNGSRNLPKTVYCTCPNPQCGEIVKGFAPKTTTNDHPLLEDDDYIFFTCNECGTSFFVHTTVEIERTGVEIDPSILEGDFRNHERKEA